MMREIKETKFRAWDTREEKMLYKEFFDRNWYATPYNDENGCHCVRCLMPEDRHYLELMQYIGRKDKNGEEIWEDSLLRDPQGNVGRVFYHNESCSYLINWHRKDGTWKTDNCFGYGVVIGNYWENPELLEVKK
jgi:uncharacterized phage protein (TIGR01671 family)